MSLSLSRARRRGLRAAVDRVTRSVDGSGTVEFDIVAYWPCAMGEPEEDEGVFEAFLSTVYLTVASSRLTRAWVTNLIYLSFALAPILTPCLP